MDHHRPAPRDCVRRLTPPPRKIAIVGGGPSGLYLSMLLKKNRPDFDITVYERNSLGDAFGFGVVFSDETLDTSGMPTDLPTPRSSTVSSIGERSRSIISAVVVSSRTGTALLRRAERICSRFSPIAHPKWAST